MTRSVLTCLWRTRSGGILLCAHGIRSKKCFAPKKRDRPPMQTAFLAVMKEICKCMCCSAALLVNNRVVLYLHLHAVHELSLSPVTQPRDATWQLHTLREVHTHFCHPGPAPFVARAHLPHSASPRRSATRLPTTRPDQPTPAQSRAVGLPNRSLIAEISPRYLSS